MNTLILYTSKHGTAEKCAQALAAKLKGQVLVRLLTDNPPEMTDYDTVILGGSIYAGGIQKAMKDFAPRYQASLLKKRLGLFVCCMSEEAADKQLKSAFPEVLVNHAITTARLGGGFPFSKMSFMEKIVIKKVLKSEAKKGKLTTIPDGKTDIFELSEANVEKMAAAINA